MEIKKEAPFISDELDFLAETKNECASCDKMFKFKSDMGVHMESVHNKMTMFTAELFFVCFFVIFYFRVLAGKGL